MPPRSTSKLPASAARPTRAGRGVAAKSPTKSKRAETRTPAKQYRQIDGVRYDDKALGVADDAVKARGKITLSDARKVFESVLDGPGITRTEYDTLAFVANGGENGAQYRVVASAKAFLLTEAMADASSSEDAATTVKKRKRRKNETAATGTTTEKKARRASRLQSRETETRTVTTPRRTSKRGREFETERFSASPTRPTGDGDEDDAEDDARTTVKKKRPRRTTAAVTAANDANDANDAHTPAEVHGNDARYRDRSVRFRAEVVENAKAPYARSSPPFAASPPPASPSTWLRRRSLSADVSPEPSLVTRATSDGDEDGDARYPVTRDTRAEPSFAPAFGARAADQPASFSARDSAKIASTRESLFAVLERPVSARAAVIAVAGAFAASAATRFAASVLFKARFGDAGLDARALAARWAEVESAAERLADALAAKRMVSR